MFVTIVVTEIEGSTRVPRRGHRGGRAINGPRGLEEAVSAIARYRHGLRPGADRARQLSREADAGSGDLRQVVASQPEPATPAAVSGVAREHDDAVSDAPHLEHAGNRSCQ